MAQLLSPSALLDVWDKGMSLSAIDRALLLLATGFPHVSTATLAQQSIGQRNQQLLILRERLFGAEFACTAICPQCTERLEFRFAITDIMAQPSAVSTETLRVEQDGYTVEFRLPNSNDLLALPQEQDETLLEQELLARCLLSARQAEDAVSLVALPPTIITAITAAMEQADSQANIELALTCPTCSHLWQALLDLPTFMWRELDAWARRVLVEVHLLASAYGWHEQDILNMRPWRRQFYLGMISR